jgi:hypothetical protein
MQSILHASIISNCITNLYHTRLPMKAVLISLNSQRNHHLVECPISLGDLIVMGSGVSTTLSSQCRTRRISYLQMYHRVLVHGIHDGTCDSIFPTTTLYESGFHIVCLLWDLSRDPMDDGVLNQAQATRAVLPQLYQLLQRKRLLSYAILPSCRHNQWTTHQSCHRIINHHLMIPIATPPMPLPVHTIKEKYDDHHPSILMVL